MNTREQVYWQEEVPSHDDYENRIFNDFVDGQTLAGPWAIMSADSWSRYGVGSYGPGKGQWYRRQSDGRFLKVKG